MNVLHFKVQLVTEVYCQKLGPDIGPEIRNNDMNLQLLFWLFDSGSPKTGNLLQPVKNIIKQLAGYDSPGPGQKLATIFWQ